MKRERIERLATDAAAGELNEDVEALFNAYLAEHPQAKKWADQMLSAYKKTQAAISEKTSRANTTAETAFISSKAIGWMKWPSVGRSAAILAFGILIGFTAAHWGATGKTTKIAQMVPTRGPSPVKTVSDLKEKYAGTFWGDKILASLEPGPYPKQTEYKWNREFWPNIKQYIKEKHYE